MNEKDLRIIKGITEHTNIALDFSFRYGTKLFLESEVRVAAKPIIEYVRAYKSKPTKRALLEKNEADKDTCTAITNLWNHLENLPLYNESDYVFDVEQLKWRYSRSKLELIKQQSEFIKDPEEAAKLYDEFSNEVKSLNKTSSYTVKSLKEYIPDFIQQYKAKLTNPELGRGILTGYSYIDYIKNGLRPSDLVIIAGETGAGKSIFLNNIAINVWKQSNTIETSPNEYKTGYNVVYFSLEMPFEDCFQRTMAALADVPSYGIRDAKLNRIEAQSVKKASRFIKNYPHHFDIIDVPRGLTVDEVELHIQRIKGRYNPDVIFIDYLSLMEDLSDSEEDWLKLGDLTGKIHELTRAYNIPIITAVQLNRMDPSKKEDVTKRIGLHRIGRSALIATHATLIMQIEDVRPHEQQLRDFKYYILKNRHGESGGNASIIKNFAHCLIKDVEYDVETVNNYTANLDISDDISVIMAELDEK